MEENLTQETMPTEGQTSEETPVFTKSYVNDLMRKRVERSHNAFFNRYGVKDLNELDSLFGQASEYGPLKENFDKLTSSNNELSEKYKDLSKRYAFKAGNVNPDRITDIETYFKGKGIDIDENTLAEEIKNHPEWVTKISTIQAIGAEAVPTPTIDERELASRYFGVNLKKG